MRLKRLIGLSLILYFGGVGTILLVGLWIIPPHQIGGLRVQSGAITQPASGVSSDATASSTAADANSPTSSISASPNPSSSPTSSGSSNTSTSSSSNQSSSSGSSPTPTPTPTPSPTPSPSPSPTPPPPPPPPPPPGCGSAGGACTNAQVAAHNSQTNCWIIYNGGYYIVTSYVGQHPGGKSVFNSSTCGRNITGYLNGSQSSAGQNHSHGSTAYNVLNSYYVGPVVG